MLNIPVPYDQAVAFAAAVYDLEYSNPQANSSSPLTKNLGGLSVDSLDDWLRDGGTAITMDHRCYSGFYVYMMLSRAADVDAVRSLYFDVAYYHSVDDKYTRPDKGIVYAAFMHDNIMFANIGGRAIFRLTEKARAGYMDWLHRLTHAHIPNLSTFSQQ